MTATPASKLLGLLLLTAVAGSAHAAITLPGGDSVKNGDFIDIKYGDVGNIFQLNALLFVDGITDQISTELVPFGSLLQLDKTGIGPAGLGTGLARFSYRVTNNDTKSLLDLRFMTVLGVDGNPNTFQESVAETWGAKGPTDPSRRQTTATFADALNNIWISGNGAVAPDGSGVPAACLSPSLCDTFVGLQWDIPELKAGESFLVTVGLSDDGRALSSRFLTVTADPAGGVSNQLTFSGTAQIVAVPEASSLSMLLAGIAALGGLAWRRRAS